MARELSKKSLDASRTTRGFELMEQSKFPEWWSAMQSSQPPLPPQVAKAFYPLPGVKQKPRPLGVDFYTNGVSCGFRIFHSIGSMEPSPTNSNENSISFPGNMIGDFGRMVNDSLVFRPRTYFRRKCRLGVLMIG